MTEASLAIRVGAKVPNFEAEGTGGPFVLADNRDRLVVLYFYPKDNTPGCTTEGSDFAKSHAKFGKAGAIVLGVSRDSVKSHQGFKSKMQFPFELISDPDEQLCQLFGVIKMKNMYGKKVRGIERSTFVIDRGGKLAREWRGVRVPNHVDDVLAYVQSIA